MFFIFSTEIPVQDTDIKRRHTGHGSYIPGVFYEHLTFLRTFTEFIWFT